MYSKRAVPFPSGSIYLSCCSIIGKHKTYEIIDLAAQADIEDIMLLDLESVFNFLDMEPIPVPTGNKGKAKMKKIFRTKGQGYAYHAGEGAENLIKALDLDKIISASPVPLHRIQDKCFDCF